MATPLLDFIPQLTPYRQLRIFFPDEGDGEEHDRMPVEPLDENLTFQLDVTQKEQAINVYLVNPGDPLLEVVPFACGLRELADFLEKLQRFCEGRGLTVELHSPF